MFKLAQKTRAAVANIAGPIPAPLSPREMVTDQTLRDLARGGDERGYGEISIEDQAVLAMILPDICGELLARRAVALKDAGQ